MTNADSAPPIVLSVRGIRLTERSRAINADILEGEIVGLAGLEGHGQQRFLEPLCGLHQPLAGTVETHLPHGGHERISDHHSASRAGIAYVPRERKTEGIFPALTVLDNFAIATLRSSARLGFLDRRAQRQQLASFKERLSMVFAAPHAPITSLSGGNQQKLLLARWLAANPRIMLLNDPTRGVDVQTKTKLYQVFREMAQQERRTLVLLSTEIDELLQLCDRTLVFREGNLFAELPHSVISRAKVIAAMFGRENDDQGIQ